MTDTPKLSIAPTRQRRTARHRKVLGVSELTAQFHRTVMAHLTCRFLWDVWARQGSPNAVFFWPLKSKIFRAQRKYQARPESFTRYAWKLMTRRCEGLGLRMLPYKEFFSVPSRLSIDQRRARMRMAVLLEKYFSQRTGSVAEWMGQKMLDAICMLAKGGRGRRVGEFTKKISKLMVDDVSGYGTLARKAEPDKWKDADRQQLPGEGTAAKRRMKDRARQSVRRIITQ